MEIIKADALSLKQKEIMFALANRDRDDSPTIIIMITLIMCVFSVCRGLGFRGSLTHTADALQQMKDIMFTVANGDRDDAPNVAVVLSDGNSNINQEM